MLFNRDKKRIFLDYASITPIDDGVVEKMKACREKYFANPSALYLEAREAKEELDIARRDCASSLSCKAEEIIFTSGGTESDSLAILGVFEAYKKNDFVPHIITSVIEHSAVLEACREVERRGGQVTYLSVSKEGLVSPEQVISEIKSNTVLISVMYVNNEIGTIEPIRQIVQEVKKWKQDNNSNLPLIHSDACQAFLYLNSNVNTLGLDLMSLDGIKIHGPRSSGLLFVRKGVKISPIIFGGGQQKGLRSGTEDLATVVGLSYAMTIADSLRGAESDRLTELRDYLIYEILKSFPNAKLNGHKEKRLPNNINICFPSLSADGQGVDAEYLVVSLDVLGFAVSYSSSCRALHQDSSSYVVSALGDKNCSSSSLRITLGRETTKDDLDKFIETLKQSILN